METITRRPTHVHTLDCDVHTVTTVRHGVTTHSVEFDCQDAQDTAALDAVLDLEAQARVTAASVTFAPMGLPQYLVNARHTAAATARERLYAAVDALTPAQAAAYGQHRLSR